MLFDFVYLFLLPLKICNNSMNDQTKLVLTYSLVRFNLTSTLGLYIFYAFKRFNLVTHPKKSTVFIIFCHANVSELYIIYVYCLVTSIQCDEMQCKII